MAPSLEGFRLQAVHYFLTYPQCPIPKELILTLLCQTFARNDCEVKQYVIANERHEDGSMHAHAYIGLNKKGKFRGESCFDLIHEGITYHGNYQAARKIKDVIAYVKKDGDYIEQLCNKRSSNDIYAEANAAENAEEFFRALLSEAPRDTILNYERLEYYAEKRFKKDIQPYSGRTLEEFNNVPQECMDWYLENVVNPQPERPRSLMLYGPTRLGKTEWARALGRHVYWNGMFNLSDWDDDAQYAIFDDMEWRYFVNWKSWLGGQRQFSCTDKYTRKKTINWGHPCIWLSNDYPLAKNADGTYKLGISENDAQWLRSNCTIVQAWQPFWV